MCEKEYTESEKRRRTQPMKAESAFGVVENELRDCRELQKETVSCKVRSLTA